MQAVFSENGEVQHENTAKKQAVPAYPSYKKDSSRLLIINTSAHSDLYHIHIPVT
jgi:hypothetical protein